MGVPEPRLPLPRALADRDLSASLSKLSLRGLTELGERPPSARTASQGAGGCRSPPLPSLPWLSWCLGPTSWPGALGWVLGPNQTWGVGRWGGEALRP